jgi:hypothetical protein
MSIICSSLLGLVISNEGKKFYSIETRCLNLLNIVEQVYYCQYEEHVLFVSNQIYY